MFNDTFYLDNSTLRHWDRRWCICIVRVGPSQAWCGMSSAWAPLELSLLLFGLLVTILTWFGSALIQTEFRRLFDHSTPNGLIIFLVIVFRALKDNIRITETDCWRPETLCFKQNNFWKLCYSFQVFEKFNIYFTLFGIQSHYLHLLAIIGTYWHYDGS